MVFKINGIKFHLFNEFTSQAHAADNRSSHKQYPSGVQKVLSDQFMATHKGIFCIFVLTHSWQFYLLIPVKAAAGNAKLLLNLHILSQRCLKPWRCVSFMIPVKLGNRCIKSEVKQ